MGKEETILPPQCVPLSCWRADVVTPRGEEIKEWESKERSRSTVTYITAVMKQNINRIPENRQNVKVATEAKTEGTF